MRSDGKNCPSILPGQCPEAGLVGQVSPREGQEQPGPESLGLEHLETTDRMEKLGISPGDRDFRVTSKGDQLCEAH